MLIARPTAAPSIAPPAEVATPPVETFEPLQPLVSEPELQPVQPPLVSQPRVAPSMTALAARGVYEAAGAAIDLTFGTHFALEQRYLAGKRLAVIREENAAVRSITGQAPQPDLSATRRQELQKNADALLYFNKHDRYRLKVRRRMYGEGVGVGGLVYGGGFAVSSSIFGSFSPALAAASVPMTWVGGPILSVAAAGMGTYEGFRSYRAKQAQKHSERLLKTPVVGNEQQVQRLLAKRLKHIKHHAMVNAASLYLLTAAAPLAIIGIVPGLALAIPGFAGTTLCWYYSLTQLKYTPRLSAAERLQLGGRRDYINRIDRAHQDYEVLKKLKDTKRLLYPHGGNRLWGLRHVAEMVGAWRRRSGKHKDYEPAAATVVKFLQMHTDVELGYYTNKLTLNTYEQSKVAELPAAQQAAREMELLNERFETEEARVASSLKQTALAALTDPTPVTAGLAFAAYVAEYDRGHDLLAGIIDRPEVRDMYVIYDVVRLIDGRYQLDTDKLVAILNNRTGIPEHQRQYLAEKTCEFAESFLFKDEKKYFTDSERELLDMLNARLVFRAKAKTMSAYGHTSPLSIPALPTSS